MSDIRGLIAATLAFVCWGIFPVYWKMLQGVPALEVMLHRMFWSLLLTIGLVYFTGRLQLFRDALRVRKNLVTYTTTSLLLSGNWLLYIWAVNAGYIIESSLGYFINPLLNVFFGMVFFRERMRPLQWFALFLALLGVGYLTVFYGRFPWIALGLALCFAFYGVLHKKSKLGPLEALCLETGILFVPAGLYLGSLFVTGDGAFGRIGVTGSLLLMGAAVVTTVPLLLFGYAAQRIQLSTLGLIQYLAPSINLLLGIFIYCEEFPASRFVGFSMVWGALIIFMGENMLQRYKRKRILVEKEMVDRV